MDVPDIVPRLSSVVGKVVKCQNVVRDDTIDMIARPEVNNRRSVAAAVLRLHEGRQLY